MLIRNKAVVVVDRSLRSRTTTSILSGVPAPPMWNCTVQFMCTPNLLIHVLFCISFFCCSLDILWMDSVVENSRLLDDKIDDIMTLAV